MTLLAHKVPPIRILTYESVSDIDSQRYIYLLKETAILTPFKSLIETVILEYLDSAIHTLQLLYNSVSDVDLCKGTFAIIHQCTQQASSYFHRWLTL